MADNWGENDKPVTQTTASTGTSSKKEEPWGQDDKAEGPGFLGRARDLGLSAAKGVVAVPEAAVGLADIATGGRVGKFLENEDGAVGFRSKQAKEVLSDLQTDQHKEKLRQFGEADGIVDKAGVALSNPSLIANTVVESVPSMLGGAVVGRGVAAVAPRLAGAGAAAIGEGVAMAGSAAEQTRQQTEDGLLTPKQSALAAGSGAIGAGFGFLGGRVAQKLGIGDIDTMAVQGASGLTAPVAGASQKAVTRQVIEGAITEGLLEELPQSVSETLMQNLALNKPWNEGLDEAIVLGTLSGGVMGAGAAGVRGFTAGRQPAAVDEQAAPQVDPQVEPALEREPNPLFGRGDAPVLNEGVLAAAGVRPNPVLDTAAIDRAVSAPTQSQQMGLDPNAGMLSAAAVAAVDGGASAQTQAQEQAKAQESAKSSSTEASQANIKAISDRRPAITLEEAQALVATPGAKENGLMIAPHASGTGYTVVPSRWLSIEGQAQAMALQKATKEGAKTDAAASPDNAAQGQVAPATQGTPENGDVITDAGGKPFAKKIAAGREMNKRGLSATHEVASAPTGKGFIVRKKQEATDGQAADVRPGTGGGNQPGRIDAGTGVDAGLGRGSEPGSASASAQQAPAGPAQSNEAGAQPGQAAELSQAANEAATSPQNDLPEPTQAQKDAGNYKKGHTRLHGLDIAIENPAGSTRSGVDGDGKAWENTLQHHYGYIKRTEGADGDHVDTFIGPNPDSQQVFVVDQIDPATGKFDEHKVMMGFDSIEQARAGYAANYAKGWKGGKAVTATTVDGFKDWLATADTKAPFGATKAEETASKPAETGSAIDPATLANKTVDTMTDAQLLAARDHYGPDHKRAKSIAKQIDKRGLNTAGEAAPASPVGTAPEHATVGVDDRELSDIVEEFNSAQESMLQDDDRITHVFDAPEKNEIVRLNDKAKVYHKDHGWMTLAEAKAKIAEWKAHAAEQGQDSKSRSANSDRIVLSLFDLTGQWSKPWEDAGYQVYRFDIQDDATYEHTDEETGETEIRKVGDVNNLSVEFFNDMYGAFDGNDVYAILAACPCTDFAVSGARHFAAKDADGRTVASVNLVHQTLRVIEYFKPPVWALENPVGRIEKLGGLPPWRLSFDPNHLGDPYTKKTLIWGRFNGDLPIAPVEPTEGSKMHKLYGGKSQKTKNARSETPEGFSYGFFMANNAIDNPVMALANQYDRLDRDLIKQALDAGVTAEAIESAVADPYYFDLDDEAGNQAIRDLIAEATPPEPKKEPRGVLAKLAEKKAQDQSAGAVATPRTVTVTVNDQQFTLTPEQEAAWDAAEADYKRAIKHAESVAKDDRQYGDKLKKAAGMKRSAERRQITGALTGKEQQAAEADAAKIRKGDTVKATVGGKEITGTVEGIAFGKVRINDGTQIHGVTHADVTKITIEQQVQDYVDGKTDTVPELPAKPETVKVPDAVAMALEGQLRKHKGRITRLKNELEKTVSLADKLQLQTKLKAAEASLRQMRTNIFQAEDAALEAIKTGDLSKFSEHEMLFPDADAAIQAEIAKAAPVPELSPLTKARNDLIEMRTRSDAMGMIADDRLLTKIRQQEALIKELEAEGQNDELDAEMRSYEAKADAKPKRPKAKEESQQEKSDREFRENYDHVANTDDLSTVETKDLDRAVMFVEQFRQREQRKGWDGGEVNKNLVDSLKSERERIDIELKKRREQAPAPESPDKLEKLKAQADLMAGLADLADIFGKNAKLNITPEQEQKLMPVLSKVMDAAFRLGYYSFKDAARFVLNTIRDKIGAEVADQISLDHVQGAYITMAGKYKDQGASTKKEVIAVESLEELAEVAKNQEQAPVESPTLEETPPKEEQDNDSATTTDSPALDFDLVEGQRPEGSETPARGAKPPRARRGRADARSVRDTGGLFEGANDGGQDLGDGAGLDAIPAGQNDTVAGGVQRVSADYRPALGGLTREGSWFDTASRNIDLIELAIAIDKEKRPATPEEQSRLSKYVGFGASAIRNPLFPIPPSYAKQQDPNRLIWPNLVEPRWKPLAERLDALPRDWQKSILQSTQYAHYTSEGIVRSAWAALQRMGFTGGKVMEPGMGIGSFAMLMPDTIYQTSTYTGIEFDGPTALIAKLLSPDQNMIHGDFIKRKLPRDFFDVAIGNPPFSQTKILGDPDYEKQGFMLHDFFFAKSIDRVRPGGLLAFVTSKGTMDKQTDKARKYLSERADLMGAIRLPSTAFEANAGTSVVTDVIFLRKRAPGTAPAGEAWQNVATVETQDGPVVINEYFANHPEMVLGQNRISGNVDDEGRRINSNGMGGEKYTVVSYDKTPEELDAKFAAAIERLPENVYSVMGMDAESIKEEVAKYDFDPSVKRDGVVYVGDDGALMRVEQGVGKPLAGSVKFTEKDNAWMKSYIGLRDLVQAARAAQAADGDWEKPLKALNKAYDKFRKEHGPINAFRTQVRKSTDEDGNPVETEIRIFTNRRRFREDYDAAIVTQLETINEAGEVVKAPFLLDRTIGKPVERTIQSIGDALAVSLDSVGRLDLADVAKRINLSVEDAIEALGEQIYKAPSGQWQLADEYLSGDVVTKLEEAEEAARLDKSLLRNVEALKKAQPEKLGPSQISAKLGSSWIPAAHVNAFAKEIEAGAVTFDAKTETWQVAGGNERSARRAGAEYGTAKRSPSELLEAALNSRSVKVTAKTADGKTVVDQEATTAATEALKKIKDKFKGWVWTDSERAAELVESYNKRYNNIAPRLFDGSHLTLPGVSLRFKLHPHQLRAIWRVIQTGNTYLAHAVGAGKTIEMIAAGMEQKRLGLIKKPMYVVPNHMLEQFSNEFMELYPLANIMVADDENFSPERRRAFIASATLNNPDAIIITHDAFQRIGVKEESIAPIRDEILADLEMELESVAKDSGARVRRGQLEQQIEAVTQRFDRILAAGGKDSTIKFEDIGADFIFADEAHVYRKLDFHTAQQIKGIDPNGSKRALDMYVKTRYLEKQRPGRSMGFASGTPVTNTMGELYTIMRYFAADELDRAGISSFDAWSRMFGEVVPALEPNAAGKYEIVERFAKFDNVPELMSRVRQFMDVLTSEHLGALVKRPDLKGGKPNLNIVAPTAALEAYMKGELARRIEISKNWKPSKDEPNNPDPIVAIITDGRFAAIDPRFFGGTIEEGDTSIIHEMADKVVLNYHATVDNVYVDKDGKPEPIKGSTQIVFYNLGFGEASQRSRGFNSRAAFTKRLTDGGVKREHIAWFDDANTDAKKEAIFKAMRAGQIRVLIGSAKKMGTGVNVQKRLAVLHYQDPPWYPADVEQPHGRIIRQGNQNSEVGIEWYTTKGTYQSTMWQMVARKQRFIDQAFTGDKNMRSMDDLGEASLFEQAAAVASGDPRAIQLAGLKQDVERFERLQAAHANEQIAVRSSLKGARWQKEDAEKAIILSTRAYKAIGEKYFAFTSGTVEQKAYDKVGEFGQALKDAFNKIAKQAKEFKPAANDREIGKIGDGVSIRMVGTTDDKENLTGKFKLYMTVGGVSLDNLAYGESMGDDVDAVGLGRRVGNQLNGIEADLRKAKQSLTSAETDIVRLTKKLGAPFEYQQEMLEKYGELKRLEEELRVEGLAKAPAEAVTTVINEDGTAPGEAPPADVAGSRKHATTGISPADKAIYGIAAEGKSATDILKFIQSASRNPLNRQIARLLLKTGINPSVALHDSKGMKFKTGTGKYAAAYDAKADAVYLFRPAEAERHALHEFVHAATMAALRKKGLSSIQMKALFAHVKKSGKLKGMYGMENVDEFVAEAFTNPGFQRALRKVGAPKSTPLHTAWDWLINIIKDIIGLPKDQTNALSQALDIGVGLMRENRGLGRANAGVRGSFAGERASTADKHALASAQQRLAAGEDADAVRQDTGWHKGVDGKWRFEINDADASLQNLRMEDGESWRATNLADILDHPALFAAYPALANMDVKIDIANGNKNKGSYSPGSPGDAQYFGRSPEINVTAPSEALALKTLLHEIQHGIQQIEGFATGTSARTIAMEQTPTPSQAFIAGMEKWNAMLRQRGYPASRLMNPQTDLGMNSEDLIIEDIETQGVWLAHRGGMEDADISAAMIDAFGDDRPAMLNVFDSLSPYEQYQRSAGEVESRNVEKRQKMTAAERRATPPIATADVADRDMIVIFNGEEMESAPPPGNGNSDKAKKRNLLRERFGQAMTFGDWAKIEASAPINPVDTPAFRSWFGDSKVVDAAGKPLVVHHGTDASFNTFEMQDGVAYFAESMPVARTYGNNVVSAYLAINNPLDLTDPATADKVVREVIPDADQDASVDAMMALEYAREEFRAYAETRDHDGLIVPTTASRESMRDGGRAFIAFNPTQIKSATSNNGDFDPDNADIRFSGASASGFADYAKSAVGNLNATFNAPGKLSWWHKTIGTMYNLAERSPAFKRVFDAAQGFIDDVSHYANDAADLAPRLLPKMETWRDIWKSPISAADNKAIARPIFEGTLSWSRDLHGKPVAMETLEKDAAGLTAKEKADRLLAADKLSHGMHRAWLGLPEAKYEQVIESRYASQFLQAGIVWTPAELKSMFGLTDQQIGLYQEFREATDRSLDTMARADMLKYGGDDVADLKRQVMAADNAQDAALILRDRLVDLAGAMPDRETQLTALANGIIDRADRLADLQGRGYAPLSRFGKHKVYVKEKGEKGDTLFFSLYESAGEANAIAAQMREQYPGAEVIQGTMSQEEFKLFAGITPESLELFGNMLGLDSTGDKAQDQAFQDYLRLTKNNRSALKRLIHRKGTAGFSEDSGRVLASFIYSNARQTAAGLNMGELGEAITEIPNGQGELKDAAMRLAEYIKNPQEEAQAIRGLLFAQYLGGSIASAFVNMTQPVAVSFPWLSQYGGARKAAAALGTAAKHIATRGYQYETDLARALKDAEDDGTVSPQEVHQLMAQARGAGTLQSGDGTKIGDAMAKAKNGLSRLSMAWGKVFGAAEQVNRRITFIAAYRLAKDQGINNPATFARRAVTETQFIYSKANKMQWGRGAVGGTLMTFKTYSVAYLELLHRMYTQGGPEGKKAALLALGVLMLMGGAGGLPFAEDAEDAADGLAQLMGYNISVKKARQEFLIDLFGDDIASFIDKGVTGLPGAPLDVSGRLGMGNLIPGTGLFQEKSSHTRDVLEVVGPMGDFANRVVTGGRKILGGDIGAGLLEVSPTAVRNAFKGGDMAVTGMYRDQKGYKVLETSHLEAALKAIGFQPQTVATVQEANYLNQRAKNFYSLKAQEIRAKWAQGIFEKDPAKVQEAREEIADWNAKNPEQRMIIRIPDVMRRVREMGKSKDQRIADTAPKAMRAQLREEISDRNK